MLKNDTQIYDAIMIPQHDEDEKEQNIQKPKSRSILQHMIKLFLYTIILIFISMDKKTLEDIKTRILSLIPEHEYKYFSCFCGMGRYENLYARELIQHYISLGVEKFYLGDNNYKNTEKLSDVLQDYINNGTVEITNLIGTKNYKKLQSDTYQFFYSNHKKECKWMMYFDFDEFLYFTDKNITTMKDYLSHPRFDKCDVVKVNWVIYDDNDLVLYDNRPVKERFTRPDFSNSQNKYIKSIVRGNIFEPIWSINGSPHTPNRYKSICNSVGIRHRSHSFTEKPDFSLCYLAHYRTKTIEEFAYKTKRGWPDGSLDYQERLNFFFENNKYTDEKLEVYKRALNVTNVTYHI